MARGQTLVAWRKLRGIVVLWKRAKWVACSGDAEDFYVEAFCRRRAKGMKHQ